MNWIQGWALLAATLAATFGAAPAAAQTPQPLAQRLDPWLAALAREQLAAGSVAVLQGDAPPYLNAIGPARLSGSGGGAQPAGPGTRYRIGSISKAMTAVMVMQLAAEGRLRLEDPIARWYPTLPRAERITVEHLLGHRSGLGELNHLHGFFDHWVYSPRGEAELVAAIASLMPAFEPGQRAAYNNSGYLLLSFIVEKAGGEPYAQALQRRIAGPLGLRDTAFDAASGLKDGEAASLQWRDGAAAGWQEMRASETSVPVGAGGIVSSPRDLVVFIRALFTGRLLAAPLLARMTDEKMGFGLGLTRQPVMATGPARAAAPWGHQGFIDGTASMLVWYPETQTAVAWCGNGWRLPRDAVLAVLRQAVLEPSARLPQYRPLTAEVRFEVDLGPAMLAEGQPPTVHLRGNASPLSWDRNLPLARVPGSTRYATSLHVSARDGVPLEYKYLLGDNGWERTDNRLLAIDSAAPLTIRDRFNTDAPLLALRQEILAVDDALFEAFNQRRLEAMVAIFSPRLEFFHDRTGLTGHAENMRQFAANFAPDRPRMRRERVSERDEVFPLGSFGALHLGAHRFCPVDPKPDRPAEACQTFRFTNVWERTPAGWQLLRLISYDH